ncbi:DapH/DapD/GlmU-related protein [Rhodoferax sp. TS-BS-61-7]|uniref:DapH/DapD/GlmU-related protein n=1 Tax=Rhodoferax sp. TS-BS-61-7 TaxID=2094194 RepID=UPI000CF5E003|nr:DapH/DapD/GlmU-related protein [Rhodoferax sp. TS-BS-61-7]PQA77836.1 hypothetical protein C5F53_09405 [Rhodoferax sp. TS-BS-61-7]
MRVNKFPTYAKQIWWIATIAPTLRYSGVLLGVNIKFYGKPIISLFKNSVIQIGNASTICSSSFYTALGVNHPTVIRTLREGACIVIGDHTGISGGSICSALSVKIGHRCLIGANVTISDSDFHPSRSKERRYTTNQDAIASSPVEIGDNVFIGANSIILKGVTIGENSVIGAGSVVTKSIPSNCVVAGNPARVIKLLD